MSNFVDCERDQAFLLPPDLRDWIPEDDLAHFVIEAVERVEMSSEPTAEGADPTRDRLYRWLGIGPQPAVPPVYTASTLQIVI